MEIGCDQKNEVGVGWVREGGEEGKQMRKIHGKGMENANEWIVK